MINDDVNTTDAQDADDWSQRWSEAGALVIRPHIEGAGWALGEAQPVDIDLTALDEGFVSFFTRFVQRRGHVAFGTAFEMAEAWGIEVEGDYALCSAADPNLVLWPRSSMAYLSTLVYLIQRDPDTLDAHEIDPSAPVVNLEVIKPALTPVDVAAYNAKLPQDEPRWLPAVLCGSLAGIGVKARGADADLSSVLASIIGGSGAALDLLKDLGLNVAVGVVGKDGKVTRVFGEGEMPDTLSDLDADADYNYIKGVGMSPNGKHHA
jgi:hypothetical protein